MVGFQLDVFMDAASLGDFKRLAFVFAISNSIDFQHIISGRHQEAVLAGPAGNLRVGLAPCFCRP